MRKIRVEDAVGQRLCHDITAMRDGFKGAAFRRGHVISKKDIEALLAIGKKHIFIWEDKAGEIHEEEAAQRLATMASLQDAHYEGPSEGKMVLKADTSGMFRVNRRLLSEINRIGDITITTLPDHYPVQKGDRMASMRIIPLVTTEEQIEQAEKLCQNEKLLSLLPYKKKKVGIIITGSEIYEGRIADKFEMVAKKKLTAFPCEVLGATICDDRQEQIVEAAQSYLDQGAELLLFSGGMSVDPDDLTPAAIKACGAEIITYGVPSQPGNMTLVSYLGKAALVGVPGAAISLPVTVLDVLLPQLFTDVKITKEDMLALAEGGLCQLCEVCHFPNCTFGRY
ncbi:molybdopterin-binding protein [Emergencia sp. 1XD21-10]|uniref:molybdopterin-binding protein n=1 Tax=Emergencia sp. 1XD21-10 TaxID=2304569 RepID=UPI00137947EB|nr:molybdopterin-binding protein [Emergencia sp. 1XD21-10]NCF00337.1 molybdopterin-binding protein [Emergencia sp. 1XD21-10]